MLNYQIIPVTAYQQNCSLVWCDNTRSAAIIDPGGEARRLIERIEALDINLHYVWLTHGHFDHISAARQLADHFAVPVVGPHCDDAFLFESLPQQTQQFGFPLAHAFLPQRWLKDGDILTLGKEQFQVIHCPGHTPGHVVLVDLAAQLAWVGDVLFNGSIGRTDFPRGNYSDLIQSIKQKLLPLGDAITFIPGHGPISTFGHEKKTNPFLIG